MSTIRVNSGIDIDEVWDNFANSYDTNDSSYAECAFDYEDDTFHVQYGLTGAPQWIDRLRVYIGVGSDYANFENTIEVEDGSGWHTILTAGTITDVSDEVIMLDESRNVSNIKWTIKSTASGEAFQIYYVKADTVAAPAIGILDFERCGRGIGRGIIRGV